ncbi:hypothetical protein HID58_086453 [Brassica napus]|uniref:Secreted peptide n=1 Tax=Brassica napus TaxID=3708 RepID=A0ABQ7XSB1_BRANA|nr:hypothetical protein HID58_086453 [Brassica napus]
MFPHLVATFIAACVSVTLSFPMFATLLWAHVSQGLASVLPHSCCSLLPLLHLSFVVLHRHRRLVCACLVCEINI